MWILCTDVRDGCRMAFPQLTAAISYDVKAQQRSLRKELDKAETLSPFIKQKAAAEAAIISLQPGQSRRLPSEMDRQEFVQQLVDSVSNQLDKQLSELAKHAKAHSNVEAFVMHNGQTWPVYAVRITKSWDEVRDYTSRTEVVDTGDLPSFGSYDEPSEGSGDGGSEA